MTDFLLSSEIKIEADMDGTSDILATKDDCSIESNSTVSSNTLPGTPTPTPSSVPSSSSSNMARVSGDGPGGSPNHLFRVSMSEIESNLPGEDRCSSVMEHDIAAWAVIDGHGGLNACELVNDILLESIVQKVRVLSSSQNPAEVMTIIDESFQECDRVVLDAALTKVRAPLCTLSQEVTAKSGLMRVRDAGRPGCCVVVILIIGEYVYAANVGDCRAVLVSTTSESSEDGSHQSQMLIDSGTHFSPCFQTKDFIYDEFKKDGKLNRYDSVSSQVSDVSSVTNNGNDNDKPHTNNERKDEYVYEHDDFNASNSAYHVSAITKDHICTSRNEKRIVSALSRDPKPFRSSINDSSSSLSFKRVAGSLAITRAIGDGYLKHPELSFEPYIQYIPYITCRPTIKYKKLGKADKYLILASDGLYNFVTASDVLKVIDEFSSFEKQEDGKCISASATKVNPTHVDTKEATVCSFDGHQNEQYQQQDVAAIGGKQSQHEENDEARVGKKREREEETSQPDVSCKIVKEGNLLSPPTFAELLVDKCLSKAARRHGGRLNATKLKNLPQGKARREIVDDITVITVDISLYVRSLGLD